MPPSQYAALPTNDDTEEVNQFVIEDSDDERDDRNQQNRPLLPASSAIRSAAQQDDDSPPPSPITTRHSLTVSAPAPPVPGAFEYPPRSPPTAYGNSNGVIPTGPVAGPSRPTFLRRALTVILPSHYIRDRNGGGTSNDGVFANMAAKPTNQPPERAAEGPNPPSYATAQADAVPPYWETAVNSVSNLLNTAEGELVIDGMPTGSAFSFVWNLIVSASFQTIGFLLTYLLHTTHAAKYGSRTGLGITLVMYGFQLRARLNGEDTSGDGPLWGWPVANDPPVPPKPTFATAEEARVYYENLAASNGTVTPEVPALSESAATATEWLSFFLMTAGWFILTTSLVGFWRVKYEERRTLRTAHEAANPRPPPTAEEIAQDQEIIANIEAMFGLSPARPRESEDEERPSVDWDEAPGERAALARPVRRAAA